MKIIIAVAITVPMFAFIAFMGFCIYLAHETFHIPDTVRDVTQYAASLNEWKPTNLVDHFPPTIPTSALKVNFAAFPGSFRGMGYLQLRLQLPRKQVIAILAEARTKAWRIYGRRDDAVERLRPTTQDLLILPYLQTADDEKETGLPDSYTIYVFPPTQENDEACCGIAISGATNEVIYWADEAEG